MEYLTEDSNKEHEIEKYNRLVKNMDDLLLFKSDPHLQYFKEHFIYRNNRFVGLMKQIIENEGGILNFAHGYKTRGVIPTPDGVLFREWLPGAKEVYLTGDFCNWERKKYPAKRDQFGNWELLLPKNENGEYPIKHLSKLKMHLLNAKNEWVDKIPAWSRYSIQNEVDKSFDGCFWNPPSPYQWKHPIPKRPSSLKIYETHVGMAGIDPRVHTYKEFTKTVIPRAKRLGYTCIQIMALMEHSYYGSFGYHVTNFFSASSRFGTPDDLKELIDTAHAEGIIVLMDLVHSHASSNCMDGLNMLDGTEHHYFHEGPKGRHELWDSRIFDYSKWETQRFLLSNLAWWLEEYRFDGFRFDGITSMLYWHRGLSFGFTGDYREYFSLATDIDALVYLMAANDLIHKINPEAVTIAEDVSGMPSLGYKVEDGGVGFNFRLAMAIPDKWIKLLKEQKDENWSMGDLVQTLTNRRYDEKVIAYCESHDQALVGDKTLAMWLFDAEMYWNMTLNVGETLVINRGMALHKMIRLISCVMGGDGYLAFMGNEFGHPEWIDFPRQDNGWSYHHCRRRFDLPEDQGLRYKFLEAFDEAMLKTEAASGWLATKDNYKTLVHEEDKIIVYERDGLIFVFNFHSSRSFEHYRIGTRFDKEHIIILDTDEGRFGGQDRLRYGHEHTFPVTKEGWHNRPNYIVLYIPSRTAIVLKPVDK